MRRDSASFVQCRCPIVNAYAKDQSACKNFATFNIVGGLPYTKSIFKSIGRVVVSGNSVVYIRRMNLREQVEELLPNWERWYPSLFDAASDLGLIKAEVCDPNSLLLTRRHSKVRQRAADAHREKWGGSAQD